MDTVEGMPSVPAVLAWLRARSDEQLLELLRARSDLTVPAPSDLEVLGRRLDNPTSVHRAMEGLNAFDIAVLTALALDSGHLAPVPPATVIRLLGPDADLGAVEQSFAALEALALIRGTSSAAGYSVPASVVDILGPYPAGLGPPSGLDDDQLRAAMASIDDRSRGVLEALNRSSPRGICPPEAPAAPVVSGLVKAGLLTRLDSVTVEMPLEVGLTLRGEHPLGPIPTPPSLPTEKGDIARVDSTAAGQALACLQLVSRLIADLGRSPIPSLKSGGIGVRELRRLAREFDVEEHRVALGLEILAAGGMISTESRNNSWQPTTIADEFLTGTDEAAWALIAGVWLDLRRDPSRAGRRDDAARVTNVLAPDLSWTRGPADRRFVLRALAELPAGAGLGGRELAGYLGWRAPMRSAERRAALQESTMTEGTWLGVIAFDALTTAGRAVLAGDVPAATAAMAAALPAPVDKVLVQADLTVVAPGRLDPLLAARLEQVAAVESSGSATVYRVTPQSIRRALDAGLSSADLHSLFQAHSTTGVPQALTYLIDDTARRHGVLRIGGGSYLRSDDAALVAQAVTAAQAAGFVLRRIAPTVAIGSAALPDLLEALAAAGIGVTAEDAGGAVLDVRPKRWRTRHSVAVHQRWREPPVPSDEQLTALVTRMRGADDARGGRRQLSAIESVAILKEVVTGRQSAWIGYVDTDGTTTRRLIEPVVVSGGMVVAHDRMRGSMRTFALHRITDVSIDPESAPTMAASTDAQVRYPAEDLDP